MAAVRIGFLRTLSNETAVRSSGSFESIIMTQPQVRLAADIGGTFTDVALEVGTQRYTAKVLTTPQAPDQGVMQAIHAALAQAKLPASRVNLVIHGTTLATNALIERKGARTALITTEGFRDSVEMAYENRFEQYDIYIDKPPPLVPRYLRLSVPERLSAKGDVLRPLNEAAVTALVPDLKRQRIESVAIGLIHSYANPAHERRVRELLGAGLPGMSFTLSSEVCPEVREYDRLSTASANAYVQPLMAGYLMRLEAALQAAGVRAPLMLMTSGGGLTTLANAVRFPIRLVESGPAGGAILASHVAAECGLDRLLSFDMGGTTAKICLIDDGVPQTSRSFEVARQYRFMKGSGLPLRIPVIEMVEIGAGGGSIAQVDALKRIVVGPDSAGAEPGPACYARGGTLPTVTDADVVLGRIAPEHFAGGRIALEPGRAEDALSDRVGAPLGLGPKLSAFGISEVVEENMANAARVHAVERGKTLGERTMIAFGGAAPLHAARLAAKLGMTRLIVPTGAGVGSAVGFLRAPIAYEVVRSRHLRLDAYDAATVKAVLREMRDEAYAIVRQAAPQGDLVETAMVDMRYIGQGHEVVVALPPQALDTAGKDALQAAFERTYAALYGRSIPGLTVEILTWTLIVSERKELPPRAPTLDGGKPAVSNGRRLLFDPETGDSREVPVYHRSQLPPGTRIPGPAVIVEDETTTIVGDGFDAAINALGYIVMERRADPGA
jgi:N-methylhydantoinase A